MNYLPIQRLLDQGHALLVDEAGLSDFLGRSEHSALFFAGDPTRYPESNDLAVILPELVREFREIFQVGLVASVDEKALAQRYGIHYYPSLVMFCGEGYLGAITKLQDWSTYCAEIDRLLKAEPRRPPSFGVPVVDANGACH